MLLKTEWFAHMVDTAETIAEAVRIGVPWLWTVGAMVGLILCARLAFFARDQRARIRAESDAWNILNWLSQLAWISTIIQFVFMLAGLVVLIDFGNGVEDWEGPIILLVLSVVPWLLLWITYRAFWLRIR
jgi:hypothetical protein